MFKLAKKSFCIEKSIILLDISFFYIKFAI